MKQLLIAVIVFAFTISAAYGALSSNAANGPVRAVAPEARSLTMGPPSAETLALAQTLVSPEAATPFPAPETAGQPRNYEPASGSRHSGLGPIFGLLFRFLIVLGLAYGASLFLRRYHLGRLYQPAGGMRILESVSLGPQRALHIVAIGDRRLLVASCASQVTMMADVTDDYVEEIAGVQTLAPLPGSPFTRGLLEALSHHRVLAKLPLLTHSTIDSIRRRRDGGND